MHNAVTPAKPSATLSGQSVQIGWLSTTQLVGSQVHGGVQNNLTSEFQMLQTVHSGVAYFPPTGLLCLTMRWVMYWWRLRRSVLVRCRLMSSTAPTAAPGTASRSPRRDQLRSCPHQASMPPVQPPEFYWPHAGKCETKRTKTGVAHTSLQPAVHGSIQENDMRPGETRVSLATGLCRVIA